MFCNLHSTSDCVKLRQKEACLDYKLLCYIICDTYHIHTHTMECIIFYVDIGHTYDNGWENRLESSLWLIAPIAFARDSWDHNFLQCITFGHNN